MMDAKDGYRPTQVWGQWRGLIVPGRIRASAGGSAPAAGAPGHVAWTLVFGQPRGGREAARRDLAAAVDIPLRLAVIGAGSGGSEIVLRDMRTLLADYPVELADAFSKVLRALAADARDRATAG
jgi:hypothetical protein